VARRGLPVDGKGLMARGQQGRRVGARGRASPSGHWSGSKGLEDCGWPSKGMEIADAAGSRGQRLKSRGRMRGMAMRREIGEFLACACSEGWGSWSGRHLQRMWWGIIPSEGGRRMAGCSLETDWTIRGRVPGASATVNSPSSPRAGAFPGRDLNGRKGRSLTELGSPGVSPRITEFDHRPVQ
jgi:hypothetical protein